MTANVFIAHQAGSHKAQVQTLQRMFLGEEEAQRLPCESLTLLWNEATDDFTGFFFFILS